MTTPAPPAARRVPALWVSQLRSPLAGPFDLELQGGECIAVSGPSGAGKTLLLRMLADLDPNEGSIRLNGVERSHFAPPAWRRRVVYVPAEASWWVERAVDHLPAEHIQSARRFAEKLALDGDVFTRPFASLSTGERLRLSMIRGLVLRPPVLLLDEPTGPLDPKATLLVERCLRERMDEGTAVVIVTHEREQGERLRARRYVMSERRLEKVE